MTEQYTLDIFRYNKAMNFETMNDSAKLKLKSELAHYELLFQMYPEEFSNDYFVSCSARRFWENWLGVQFQLKKIIVDTGSIVEDIVFDFSKTILMADKENVKLFRQNKRFTPIKLTRWEDEQIIYFDLILKPYMLYNHPTITLNDHECEVCYQTGNGRQYFLEKPFLCDHNGVCIDCVSRILRTTHNCPMCRANTRNGFN